MCQVWSPLLVDLINRVERVLRLFTKRIHCIAHFTYDERYAR